MQFIKLILCISLIVFSNLFSEFKQLNQQQITIIKNKLRAIEKTELLDFKECDDCDKPIIVEIPNIDKIQKQHPNYKFIAKVVHEKFEIFYHLQTTKDAEEILNANKNDHDEIHWYYLIEQTTDDEDTCVIL